MQKFLGDFFGELFRGEVRGEIGGLEVEAEPALFATGNGEVLSVEDLGREPALGRACGLGEGEMRLLVAEEQTGVVLINKKGGD